MGKGSDGAFAMGNDLSRILSASGHASSGLREEIRTPQIGLTTFLSGATVDLATTDLPALLVVVAIEDPVDAALRKFKLGAACDRPRTTYAATPTTNTMKLAAAIHIVAIVPPLSTSLCARQRQSNTVPPG